MANDEIHTMRKNGEWLNDLSFSNITIPHSPATANEQDVWKSVARWESVSQNIRRGERLAISDRFFARWKNVEDCLGNINRFFRFDEEKIMPYNFSCMFSFNIWKMIFNSMWLPYGRSLYRLWWWQNMKVYQACSIRKNNIVLFCGWFCCSRWQWTCFLVDDLKIITFRL